MTNYFGAASRGVMIDLETMGLRTDAAITAIGAVAFDVENKTIYDKFYTPINLASSMSCGGSVSASTILWWMQQSDEAKKEILEAHRDLKSSLIQFSAWMYKLQKDGELEVWGNGSSFDNVILKSAYDNSKLDAPWQFYMDRCYRTVKNLNPHVPFVRLGTHHNALNDAESQAVHLMNILSVV